MSNSKPTIPKGTRDFGPVQMGRRNYIFDTIKETFKLFGYPQLETPAMENLSTLTGKYGDEGDQLLFRVLDSGEFFEKAKAKIVSPFYNPPKASVYSFLNEFYNDILSEYLANRIDDNELEDRIRKIEHFYNGTKYPLSIDDETEKVILRYHEEASESISRILKREKEDINFYGNANKEELQHQVELTKSNIEKEI